MQYVSPAQGLISIEELEIRAKQQLENEVRGIVTIKSIEKKSTEERPERFVIILNYVIIVIFFIQCSLVVNC